jgi:hypothetical protein
MKRLFVALALILVSSGVAHATSAGRVGAQFADVYARFAPLHAFYDAYAAHLFSGTVVEVPLGISLVCLDYPEGLENLQIHLIRETFYDHAGTLEQLVHLRTVTTAFCSSYGEMLTSLVDAHVLGEGVADGLAAQGFFVTIREMDLRFEATLDEALDAAGNGRARWELAVAFAVRGLTSAPALQSISEEIAGIFYGSAGLSEPLFGVSANVEAAMAEIVSLSGRTLSPEQIERARTAAEVVCDALTGDESTNE